MISISGFQSDTADPFGPELGEVALQLQPTQAATPRQVDEVPAELGLEWRPDSTDLLGRDSSHEVFGHPLPGKELDMTERRHFLQSLIAAAASPALVSTTSGKARGALVPDPDNEPDPVKREGMRKALEYMDLQPGKQLLRRYPPSNLHP